MKIKIWMAQHYSMPNMSSYLKATWSLFFGPCSLYEGSPWVTRTSFNGTLFTIRPAWGRSAREPVTGTHATHAGRCSSTEQPAHLILWPRQSGIARLLRNAGLAPGSELGLFANFLHPAWPLPTLTRLKRDRAIFSSSSSGCWPRINVPPERNRPLWKP